jgi:hypothetical protein
MGAGESARGDGAFFDQVVEGLPLIVGYGHKKSFAHEILLLAYCVQHSREKDILQIYRGKPLAAAIPAHHLRRRHSVDPLAARRGCAHPVDGL